MARVGERPREAEREQFPEEALRLEPMLEDRDYEKLYGTRAWLRDRVRLAPVFAAVFIALAADAFLITLGITVGVLTASTSATGGLTAGFVLGQAVWIVVATWLSLWLGGWYAARMAGVAGMMDGILNAVAMWGLFIVGSVILGSVTTLFGLGSLVSIPIGAGTFDLLRALNLSGLATVTPAQAAAIRSAVTAAAAGLAATIAIGAGFAILGGWLGQRSRMVTVRPGGGGGGGAMGTPQR